MISKPKILNFSIEIKKRILILCSTVCVCVCLVCALCVCE